MPEQHRILIVDDDALDRQAVVRALHHEAAEIDGVEADVLEVGTVAGAREAIGREEFSCIFLDHDLPDGTSLDLLMEVRSQGLATPIVVLTGERDEQTIVEVMRAGAVDYLPKERIHPDLVARSLRAALHFLKAQREKQAVLDELRARDRAIAAAPNGIVIADPQQPDCPIVYANEAFLRVTGHSAEEVLGRNCRFLQGEETDPATILELREAVRQERPCLVSILNYRKDGTAFWNELTISPVRDAKGTLTHFVGVQTDVTARHEADAKRRQAEEERERLLAEAKERADREALLNRVSAAIRATTDPEVIQETAAQLLGEALCADRCFYLTYDLSRDSATVGQDFRRADLPPLAGEYRLSDFQEMLAEVFADGTTASIPDVHTVLSLPVAQAMNPFGHRAVLAVPFFDEGRLVAALWASADKRRAWTAHEAALIEQAATLTRTALDMARISRKERAIAKQLQDALQPAVPEHVPGLSIGKFTRPALDEAQIGGDFYDVFPLDKDLYALVIADVSGKGLAAAQQLALIRNSLRTTLYLYRAPAQAAAALNGIVTAHDLLVGFVTAWVGIYDAATGQITYCSCGHEPGLVRRAGGAVEALETTGPPLGVAENADYSELTFTLLSGESLLLYTDGISEAGPSRRELLGTEGLMRLLGALPVGLTAQVDAEALVGQVSAHAGSVFRDDVAVLFGRRR